MASDNKTMSREEYQWMRSAEYHDGVEYLNDHEVTAFHIAEFVNSADTGKPIPADSAKYLADCFRNLDTSGDNDETAGRLLKVLKLDKPNRPPSYYWRNLEIAWKRSDGAKRKDLAAQYDLTEKQIGRITTKFRSIVENWKKA